MRAQLLPEQQQTDFRRRIAFALIAVVGIVLTYGVVYRWAMLVFVGVEISLIQSVQVVVEALTTAGFGGDTDLWRQSDALAALVILMNLSGVLLVFLALPLFVVPLFRQAFQPVPPTSTELTDHVIICGYAPQDEVLCSELEAADIPYLYVEPDRDTVIDLNESGVEAVLGNPERIDALRAANAESARALVADIDDETNATVLLSAKQVDPDLRTISVVRRREAETYHRYAGADEVVQSRRLLGKSLGQRAAGSYAEMLRETIQLENGVTITELLVEEHSDLVGQTFREATVLDRDGITVIGAWLGGKFVVTPDPDTTIEENAILLVAGRYESYEGLKARQIEPCPDGCRDVVVCGYGTVGQAVTDTLREVGLNARVIDIQPKDGVDVVGDISDPQVLGEAGIEDARAVVLSIDEDTPTIYATLIVNQLAPDTEIIARADDDETVQKLYTAGADFVIPLPQMTGEIEASILIEDFEIVTPDTDFGFVRIDAPGVFVGRSLADLDIRAETGCTVVAVERGTDLLTDLAGQFVVEDGDHLIVAGSQQSRDRLDERFETI